MRGGGVVEGGKGVCLLNAHPFPALLLIVFGLGHAPNTRHSGQLRPVYEYLLCGGKGRGGRGGGYAGIYKLRHHT